MYKYNNNYDKKKQYNEEHQYHNFFHATLCIVNIKMTSLDMCFLKRNFYMSILEIYKTKP